MHIPVCSTDGLRVWPVPESRIPTEKGRERRKRGGRNRQTGGKKGERGEGREEEEEEVQWAEPTGETSGELTFSRIHAYTISRLVLCAAAAAVCVCVCTCARV